MLCGMARIGTNDEHSDRERQKRCAAKNWFNGDAQTTGETMKNDEAFNARPWTSDQRVAPVVER